MFSFVLLCFVFQCIQTLFLSGSQSEELIIDISFRIKLSWMRVAALSRLKSPAISPTPNLQSHSLFLCFRQLDCEKIGCNFRCFWNILNLCIHLQAGIWNPNTTGIHRTKQFLLTNSFSAVTFLAKLIVSRDRRIADLSICPSISGFSDSNLA